MRNQAVMGSYFQLADAHDNLQVRPPGSPGRDPSLVDHMACPLPDHTTNCKFVGDSAVAKQLDINAILLCQSQGL
ncbi:TPA: hypothetical protein ACH3X3_003333 [Trebouxia sp. C0006]